ncbi:MAG: hypothetical protein CBC21_07170 [Proteobacteria bacterium TMED61]|nr:MAG: hypothetical protein CBC21_07170 [Proteobacteria bacterium TMED61]
MDAGSIPTPASKQPLKITLQFEKTASYLCIRPANEYKRHCALDAAFRKHLVMALTFLMIHI